jgi:AcrR family transcriptional regulator
MRPIHPSPSPRRTQAARRDESERRLVEATLAVVSKEGVNAATFDTIGRAAGYSRGLATLRFGSKRGLIEAVIAHLHQQREDLLAADHVAAMPALDAVLHYVDTHLRDLDREHGGRAYFMLLAAAVADASAMREAFADSHERVRVWLEAQIRRGQAAGDVDPGIDPNAGALMVGSLLVGLSMQWLVDPATDLEPLRTTSLAILRQSFSTQPNKKRRNAR